MFASSHPPKVPYSLKPYNFSFTGSVSQSFPHTRASFTKISVKLKMATTGKMQLLGPKFSKMTAPNFLPNPLCGPNTVFQGRWPNQGGTPQDPPRSDNLQHRQPFGARNGHVEAKIGHLEAQHGPWEATNGHLEAQNGHWEA